MYRRYLPRISNNAWNEYSALSGVFYTSRHFLNFTYLLCSASCLQCFRVNYIIHIY